MISTDHIHRVTTRLTEIETLLSDPATAANQRKFRDLVKEHAALKRVKDKTDRYLRLVENMRQHRELLEAEGSDPELKDLARGELAEMEKLLPREERDLMFALLPPDPSSGRNAIMEIRAGTGGEEAALFGADLFRMYTHYVTGKGWRINTIDASTSEIRGYREVVFLVEGEGAYGTLRYESGVHRVQRIPVTEGSGRIHTSTATVAVFPEAEPEDEIEIDPEELRIDVFCASGPGGQSVNTTYSAVRITHLPTGLVAQSQDERSQHRNREKAMAVLKARILDIRRQEEEARKGSERRSQIGSGDRSERIRTYNFPQNRVTDHRVNLTLYSLNRVIEGELDELVKTLQDQDLESRLQQERGKT